ncbi:hypothetical protein V5O48_016008 [Marasmius crinis-equi]|uniref:Uncharacterized protein n=1 Tax=Marasmius crinis-equi TaxID=585013 RepID=A0ABR3ET19_9AGAR
MNSQSWHHADGILIISDIHLARGLAMLYQQTENPSFKNDIEKYLAVQYNAILDMSTTNGSDIYSPKWIGPPPSTFDAGSQMNAIGVLVPVIAFPDANFSVPTTNSTSSSSKGVPVKQIVGSVVGGIITLAAVIGLLLWRNCKKRSLSLFHRSSDLEQAQVIQIEPFTESTRESPKRQASEKQNLDSAQRSQSLPPFSTPVTQNEQQNNRDLLQQMGATLSILNRRLAQVEGTSAVGSEMDPPPEYPESIHH